MYIPEATATLLKLNVSVQATLSLDGRHAMVSTLCTHETGEVEWNVDVFDVPTGELVQNKRTTGCPTSNVHRCARFPGLLYTFYQNEVLVFCQGDLTLATKTVRDFQATSHLFDGDVVHTQLEEMVDQSRARITQSDGRVIVYATTKAPSVLDPFSLTGVDVRKVVRCFPGDGTPEERCCISPDGLHLLTLVSRGTRALAAYVHHDSWNCIRSTCLAMESAKAGKYFYGKKDAVWHIPPSAAREILSFLLPGVGVARRYQMSKMPEDNLDIQAPFL